MNDHDAAVDALIEDAIEILTERSVAALTRPPSNGAGYRATTKSQKRQEHHTAALALLAAQPRLTAPQLANLLEPTSGITRSEPRTDYATAEQRRQRQLAAQPTGWLDPDTFRRCIADARNNLATKGTTDG